MVTLELSRSYQTLLLVFLCFLLLVACRSKEDSQLLTSSQPDHYEQDEDDDHVSVDKKSSGQDVEQHSEQNLEKEQHSEQQPNQHENLDQPSEEMQGEQKALFEIVHDSVVELNGDVKTYFEGVYIQPSGEQFTDFREGSRKVENVNITIDEYIEFRLDGEEQTVTMNIPEDFSSIERVYISPTKEKCLLMEIARFNGDDIYLVDVDQGVVHQLNHHPVGREGGWSPDGKSVAFSDGSIGEMNVYLYELESEAYTPITEDGFFSIFGVKWGQNGTFIDFAVERLDALDTPSAIIRYYFLNHRFEKIVDLTKADLAQWWMM